MSVIAEIRREREDLARVLKKHAGIRKIVEDLYPDSAHFIYELLQNAEDTEASQAYFLLSEKSLIFEHNGRPFDPRDIEAITDIGEGTKADDNDKIGRFGVGFKAVFAYSETPFIWSPTLSFKICELVMPYECAALPDLGNKTRFEFPFNNRKKNPETAFLEIEAGLRELAETTLLFLTDLESIRWEIDQGSSGEVKRIKHYDYHFELGKQCGGEMTAGSHFLKFDQPVEGLDKQRIAVAFPLDLLPGVRKFDETKLVAEQLKIIPAAPGQVSVFFPAEKETSGLRFHLHAPFVPELSRASIKETAANQPLFQQLASLVATSLHQIRDLGLLSADFLAILPNPQDALPDRYQGLRTAIVKEMNSQPLTPTHSKSHAPARQLLQAEASLKELLAEEDIKLLVESAGEAPKWAVSAAQKNSNAHGFLNGLAITKWDIKKFVELFSERTSEGSRYISVSPYVVQGPDEDFMIWLSRKSPEWHQEMYALLYKELIPNGGCHCFYGRRIVRLSNGAYGVGSQCFFPSDDVEHDDVLPRVDTGVYSSGKSKSQQENARKFLVEVGVREVGEAEQIEAILKQRYSREAEISNEDSYWKDFKRFVALVEGDSSRAGLFKDYYIFHCIGSQLYRPGDVFLDQPFLDTGLSAYFQAWGKEADRFALHEKYKTCGIPVRRVAEFAKSLGAQTRLKIVDAHCYDNPAWSYLGSVSGDRCTNPIDVDYVIPHLEAFLGAPTLASSRLVWRTMESMPECPNYLKAIYQKNWRRGARGADSQLVHQLRNAAWVAQVDGRFVRPPEASCELLPEGFPYDAGWPWLEAIQFGQDAVNRSHARLEKQSLAEKAGFANAESMDRAKRFAALPLVDQERILSNWEHR
jgi:hypothetical protein